MKKSVGSNTAKPSRRPTRLSPRSVPRSHRTPSQRVPVAVLPPRSFAENTREKTPAKNLLPKEKSLRVLIVEDSEDDA